MRIHQRTSKNTLWNKGRKTPSNNKQGFSINRKLPFMTREGVTDDTVFCEKGEKYYTWHPKGLPWQYSKTMPDLRSEYQQTLDDFEWKVVTLEMRSENEEERDSLRVEIEEYQSKLQSRLDNMPSQLQESSVLNERIEELQDLLDQLD